MARSSQETDRKVLEAIKKLAGTSNAWASLSPAKEIEREAAMPASTVQKHLQLLQIRRHIHVIGKGRITVIVIADRLTY